VGGRVSSGMRHEADHAITLAIPVIDLTALGELPPPFDGKVEVGSGKG